MPRVVVTATIPAGQSISSAIDLSAGNALFCQMPSGWTPALLTFLISYDNVTFGDFVDQNTRGNPISYWKRYPLICFVTPGWLEFRGSRFGPVTRRPVNLHHLADTRRR
jgi:hypothetical protein